MEREKREKNKHRLRDVWDTIKCTNADVIGVPEGKERKRAEKLFEGKNSQILPKFNGKH